MDHILPQAMERGLVTDGTIAASETQVTALWDIRERLSDVQKLEGGSIKHDVAVPVSLTPQFIDEASRAVAALIPDVRPVPFGHLGDGNIHFNISQPAGADKAAFLARWEEVNAVVHEIVLKLGGTISAEHGIGQELRTRVVGQKPAIEWELMRAVKEGFDAAGIEFARAVREVGLAPRLEGALGLGNRGIDRVGSHFLVGPEDLAIERVDRTQSPRLSSFCRGHCHCWIPDLTAPGDTPDARFAEAAARPPGRRRLLRARAPTCSYYP